MQNLTNNQLLDLFESNEWNAEEINFRVIAHTFVDTDIPGVYEDGEIDVTGWTSEQIEDHFGFEYAKRGDSEASYFRNNSAYGYIQ